MAKLAHGLADDMLTTTFLACKRPKIVAPAMNTNMYENPITQDNMAALERYGIEVIRPASGYLACGDVGAGKMPEPEVLFRYIEREIACEKGYDGKEGFDHGRRYPGIHGSGPLHHQPFHGKNGFCPCQGMYAAWRRSDPGQSAQTTAEPPMFVNVVEVSSAADMFEAVTTRADEQDIIIKAAAVSDYTPAEVSDQKVKKKDGDLSIAMKRTKDILMHLGEHKQEGQFLCGFPWRPRICWKIPRQSC